MTPPRLAGSSAGAPDRTTPVRTTAELTSRWHQQLGVPVFTARSLWLTWLDDGVPLPVVIPVDDVPAVPDRPLLAHLAQVCGSVAESHASGAAHVAMALCRTGSAPATADDRAWERGLREAFDAAGLPWSLHLAAGGSVTPLAGLPG